MTGLAGRARRGAPRPRTARAGAVAAATTLLLVLAACDGAPAGSDSPATPAEPMDPTAIAGSTTTAVDPSWLCDPGGDAEAPDRGEDPGTLSPASVEADGNQVTITGAFRLGDEATYRGFAPDAVVVPSAPENRGAPAPGYDALGTAGSPVPPMVVRERVEVPGEGAAPASATAQLTLGTCDDAPLPDGAYLLSLAGGGEGRAKDGWTASEDVLLDVVGGELQTVPGAVSAPEGEIPADLSALECRSVLRAIGDGDGLSVSVGDHESSVPAEAPEDAQGVSVDAEVTVASEDLGTRALLQGVVLTSAADGTVVAGARNASEVGLQWIGEEGVSTTEPAWTTRSTCTRSPLDPGAYEAYGVAVTVDDEGATHIVLSDPWSVEVLEDDAAV